MCAKFKTFLQKNFKNSRPLYHKVIIAYDPTYNFNPIYHSAWSYKAITYASVLYCQALPVICL